MSISGGGSIAPPTPPFFLPTFSPVSPTYISSALSIGQGSFFINQRKQHRSISYTITTLIIHCSSHKQFSNSCLTWHKSLQLCIHSYSVLISVSLSFCNNSAEVSLFLPKLGRAFLCQLPSQASLSNFIACQSQPWLITQCLQFYFL